MPYLLHNTYNDYKAKPHFSILHLCMKKMQTNNLFTQSMLSSWVHMFLEAVQSLFTDSCRFIAGKSNHVLYEVHKKAIG
jgi:hypothetical protein